jgi:probable rRNA maturation factor
MEVNLNKRTKTKLDDDRVKKLAQSFIIRYSLPEKELSVALVGDRVMRRLNRDYRGIDRTTDVLSFDGDEDTLGEIIICPAQVKRQTAFYSPDFETELLFILVHGLLHLAGYDDDKEEKRQRMIALGKEFLDSFLLNHK